MERMPRWRKPLLILHISATGSLIGSAMVLAALGVAGLQGADPRTIYPAAYVTERWVTAPLVLIALGTGLLLVLLTPWSIIKHRWVSVKLATTVVFTALFFAVLIPRLAETAEVATGSMPATFTTAERLPLVIAPSVAVLFLVLNAVLAIYKPEGRLQSRVRANSRRGGHKQATGRPSSAEPGNDE